MNKRVNLEILIDCQYKSFSIKDWPPPKVACIWGVWRIICVTETILVGSEIKEVWSPEFSVFESSKVVGTVRFYLLPIAILAAVTKSVLIFRSNNIVSASSGEAARDRSVHEEASALRLVFPGDREDARLSGCGSSTNSGARESKIEHAGVGEEVKQFLDIPGLTASCLNNILQAAGLIKENIVDVFVECVLFTDWHWRIKNLFYFLQWI